MSVINTRIEVEELLIEIKKELINEYDMYKELKDVIIPLKCILVSDFTGVKDVKSLYIDIDFFGIEIVRTIIPKRYVEDREYIKHQIVRELCLKFERLQEWVRRVVLAIFPYQNKLVREWEEHD